MRATGSSISRSFASLPPELRRQARAPVPLTITKANTRSTVHRPVYLDYIGVRRFDSKGRVLGEHRFLGLFTSGAYSRSPRQIPLLRRKVERIIARANLPPASHAGKALANIVETYPRDELFQVGDEELFETVTEILHLQERQRIRLFLRKDSFARYVSCLVYVPRERYHTELRRRFQDILQAALNGTEVEYQAQVSESVLARIQFIVRTPAGIPADLDPAEIEARLVEAARAEQAPFVRLADRYALWFVPLAVLSALLAWALSGDAVRAVAVLVVATPCPLLLAAPIAIAGNTGPPRNPAPIDSPYASPLARTSAASTQAEPCAMIWGSAVWPEKRTRSTGSRPSAAL